MEAPCPLLVSFEFQGRPSQNHIFKGGEGSESLFQHWEAELATASGSAGALALVAVVEHWMYVGELEDADKRSAGQCAAVQFVANSVLVWAARGFRSSYWQDTT